VLTSATGSYRKIIQKAENIEFDIVQVGNTNEDLLSPNYLEVPDPIPTVGESAVSKALRLKFSLKPSSYATMFLREATRTSSAFNVQHAMSKFQNKD
jgi:tRNA(Glu) U13 pseudouridine synthase TruD